MTSSPYRRALERVYTLIGKEFTLLIVAVNTETTGSNTPARELLLASRALSSEMGTGGFIQGPVVRRDISITEDNDDWIAASLPPPSSPTPTPLVIAFVGIPVDDITCIKSGGEKLQFTNRITGGYLVLSYDMKSSSLSHINLCEKKKPLVTATTAAKFLVGQESVTSSIVLHYAIRVQPATGIPTAQPARLPVAPSFQQQRPPVVPQEQRPVMAAIRAPRWKSEQQSVRPSAAAAPAETVPAGPVWETLVQQTVERQLSKLLPASGGETSLLGDGLVLRVWPNLIKTISGAREWLSVFTHQSVDPNPRANYEAFETLGDKVLSLALVHYLFAGDRLIDSNGLTDSHKEILSFELQPIMSATMKLNQTGLIRSSVGIDDKMLEDVYEAFFGCLFTVANRLTEPGAGNQGLSFCEELFKIVLKSSFPDLDPWGVPKDVQTTLNQIFIRLKWGKPIIYYNEETRVTTIRFTRDAISYLQSLPDGPPIRSDGLLAISTGCTDKRSSVKAATEIALEALKLGWGINTRYTSMIVRNRLLKFERYAAAQREALKVAEKMGFKDIYVARRAKNHNQLYAVVGIKPNDSEMQLHVYKYESSSTRSSSGAGAGGVGEEDVSPEVLSTRVAAYIAALNEFIKAHS